MDENHGVPNRIKCAKCGVETNNQQSWMVLHECRQEENYWNIATNEIREESQSCDICHIEMEKSKISQVSVNKESKTNTATEIEGMTLAEMTEMITLNEKVDQIEFDSQLGIITPDVAEVELDHLMASNFPTQSEISRKIPTQEKK